MKQMMKNAICDVDILLNFFGGKEQERFDKSLGNGKYHPFFFFANELLEMSAGVLLKPPV